MDRENPMLIHKKLSQGHIYLQLSQAPIRTYDEFLNFFRGGHTIDDNLTADTIRHTVQYAMFTTAVMSGHLTRTRNMTIPDESLVDIHLTKSGLELIQNTLDRIFSEETILQARKCVAEDDRLHPYVGVVIVKNGEILATGYHCESGKGEHGEFCALKKLNDDVDNVDLSGCTIYTTLEPCSKRNPPKLPCTTRLIKAKAARVVYGMADKDESVYGHASLVEAGIEIGFFPNDLMPELLALNKKWSDQFRTTPIIPPNDTSPIANVSYYKLGTSMADNTHFFVRPPKDAGGFYTVEDAARNVLAHGRTIEEIAVEWHKIDDKQVIVEKLVRQSHGSSHRLLNLT
jgi:pyrimidine deaminase RibD-like protein